MFKRGLVQGIRFALVGAALLTLGACASSDNTMKIQALESKINEALQNAAAAKIDAATALHFALEGK